jgi:hypothetical protein
MSARKPRPTKRDREEERLDEALEETFPASDTPAMIGPGGGITGPNNPRKDAQSGSGVAAARKSKRPSAN